METIQTKNIYQRLNAVMSEVDYVQKDSRKVAGQYRFVSHDTVTASLHGPMTKHGIACITSIADMKQDGNRTEVKLEVTFVNIDQPTDKLSVFYWGYGIDTSDKGIGKAVSYAFKYALLKTFVLETGDDPDQDQTTVYEAPKPKQSEMSAEEIESYINAFGDNREWFKSYVSFVQGAKKMNYTEAVTFCKNGGEGTLTAFGKWKDKQKMAVAA